MSVPEKKQEPKILATLTISIVDGNPSQRIEVVNRNMNPYMIPMMLRQLAKNYEDAIMATKSLIGD